jgi:surfactin family lipopeptide synthetase A
LAVEKTQLSETKRHLLENLLKSRSNTKLNTRAPIPVRPLGANIPLSYCQRQVWAHLQMVGDAPIYNEPITIRCSFPLDVALIEKCFVALLRRHEIWRTAFRVTGGTPVQIVQPPPDRFPIASVDLRHLPRPERESEAVLLAAEHSRRPFDLETAPLLRAFVVQMDESEFRIYVTFHQIVFDAFTAYRILVPELSGLYAAFSAGESSPLAPLPLQYGDFALWETQRSGSGVWADQLSFWRNKLAGELPVLQWPYDRQKSPVGRYQGANQRFTFKPELLAPLREFCRVQCVSSYMALLASFAALLSRYTGQDDILMGGFSAGRKQPELEPLAGYFVNPFALRIDLSGNPTFRELATRAKRTVLDALANQDVPFQKIIEDLQLRPERGRNPIFQIALSQQPLLPPLPAGWDLATEEVSSGGAKMDIIAILDERPDSISGPITYNSDLFDSSEITQMVEHWQTLLSGALANPDCRLSDLPLLTATESAKLGEWNDTHGDYPRDSCLHQLIEAQAERTPDAVALVFEGAEMRYRDLNARANQLAHHLRNIGAVPDALVGVCMDRSAEMVVALLGVLKAGAAYLPLDPKYPKDRLAFMVEDSAVKVVVTDQSLQDHFSGLPVQLVCLDRDWPSISRYTEENPLPVAGPENLLYVIYTSGSTGKPKGVQICHRAFVNLATSVLREPGISEDDTLLALTTISFDIAAAELFIPLTVGAKIIIASRTMVADPDTIATCIEDQGVTTLQATPVTWRMLIDSGWQGKRDLKIICTGEALTRSLADQLLARAASVWNMYGPTETTVWSTGCRVTPGTAPILIGRPIANTQTHILDTNLHQLPIGAVGELYIAGDGLARGYLNRPELTAERFLPNPFGPGSRIYNTGDLARFHADGSIECLGRIDRQVKIRGYRIELDEIERSLRQHQSVRDAVVIVREDTPGNPVLVGYVVLGGQDVSLRSIRDSLRQTLPPYMVPELVTIDRFPLTPNGKLDRKSLPAPNYERDDERDEEGEFAEPSDETEKLLAQLWTEALKIDRISVYDNFFDLGGNSLSAIQVLARLQQKTGVRIKPSEAAFQTLGQLAALCRERAGA